MEKIPNYSERLVLLYQGKSATIYRPNVNLYIELKVKRLTDSDLSDCLRFLKYARKIKERVEQDYLKTVIKLEIQKSPRKDNRLQRLEKLRENLDS